MTTPRPVMLVILDGWGWREESADNAVRLARPAVFNHLWSTAPHAFLRASGPDVGLPEGQMGNSEVGHLNIGAGRVVMQELPRIDQAITDGELANNPALADFIAALRNSGGTCHLFGLVSDGGVHAHSRHAIALARILTDAGLSVLVHVATDGRDTPPRSGETHVANLVAALPPRARVATVTGRYFAMDRDKRWDRVARAYAAIAEGQGDRFPDPATAIHAAYGADITDEFINPSIIGAYGGMCDGDGLLCFNFRADRVRELLGALVLPAFDGFPRRRRIQFAAKAGMTRYSDVLAPHLGTLFPPQSMHHLLGDVVAEAGLRQLRMAETEKYPHVTYFLNGGKEATLPGEDRILVPSPKVATYDLQPEMSAPELTEKAVSAIRGGTYDLIVLNYANPDMVGHTGSLEAAIKAVQTVDQCLGQLVDAVTARRGAMLIIADHGNCELMRDPETGGPHTAHTSNKVPVILVGAGSQALHDGRLADVAPTLLALMGLAQPAEMTGQTLQVQT